MKTAGVRVRTESAVAGEPPAGNSRNYELCETPHTHKWFIQFTNFFCLPHRCGWKLLPFAQSKLKCNRPLIMLADVHVPRWWASNAGIPAPCVVSVPLSPPCSALSSLRRELGPQTIPDYWSLSAPMVQFIQPSGGLTDVGFFYSSPQTLQYFSMWYCSKAVHSENE